MLKNPQKGGFAQYSRGRMVNMIIKKILHRKEETEGLQQNLAEMKR